MSQLLVDVFDFHCEGLILFLPSFSNFSIFLSESWTSYFSDIFLCLHRLNCFSSHCIWKKFRVIKNSILNLPLFLPPFAQSGWSHCPWSNPENPQIHNTPHSLPQFQTQVSSCQGTSSVTLECPWLTLWTSPSKLFFPLSFCIWVDVHASPTGWKRSVLKDSNHICLFSLWNLSVWPLRGVQQIFFFFLLYIKNYLPLPLSLLNNNQITKLYKLGR